jgi:beta-lactamase class A
MKKLLLISILLFAGACSAQKPVRPNEKTAVTEPSSQARPNQQLQKQIELIAAEAKGRVGVSALYLENNESALLNSGDHFPMQSVYKLPICMAVLRQVDAGKLKLDQTVHVTKADFVLPGQASPLRDKNPTGADVTVRELLSLAVSQSDGTASDVLMNLAGGPGAVTDYLGTVGITDIKVVNTEKEFAGDWQKQYANWAQPDAAVVLLRSLFEGWNLSSDSRALMLKLLTETSTGPKRLKGLLPAGTTVAHKTGTSGSRGGVTAATNDIGIITLPNGKHVIIAVFVSDSPADEQTREIVIAKIARAAFDAWNK